MPAPQSFLCRTAKTVQAWLVRHTLPDKRFQETEARFKMLAETLGAVPWEADLRHNHTIYVGPQIKALTGYSPGEWTAERWRNCLHPDDRDHIVRVYEENLRHRIDHALEYRLMTIAGGIVWCRDIVSFVTGAEGQPLVRGIIFCIDGEKAFEQALRGGEARYQQAERIAKLGHWSMTLGATDSWDQDIITFSDAAAVILGAPPGELAISNACYLEKFVHPEDRAQMRGDLIGGTLRLDRDVSTTYRIVRPGGPVRWVSEHMENEFNASGRRVAAFGTIQDVTGQKQSEANLRRAYLEADLANRAKSQFLANMSHELRTPLNAIIGFSETMVQEIMGPIDSSLYKGYCADIHGSGVHLLSIINDLLDLSVVEAGEAQLEETIVRLPELIDSCLVLVRNKAAERNIALTLDVAKHLPALRVDNRRMKQALLNLLVNAIKFTPPGGIVTVIADRVDADLELGVVDTGIGIAPEDRERVLQPFAQIENWLVRKHDGAGLGLPIAKAFVELHGGALRISDAPNRGTEVTITIPAERMVHSLAPMVQ